MTSSKEKLIELLHGSLSLWETLPEAILQESIYNEEGHVDDLFMMAILEFMAHESEVTSKVMQSLNKLLGCDEIETAATKKNGSGEKWTAEKILQNSKWDGDVLTLPQVQFDKKSYATVKSWIEESFGSWNSQKQGFTWDFDANRVVGILTQGKRCNLRQDYQFFATPDAVADLAASKFSSIEKSMTILEPSAGTGALINAVKRLCPEATVDCYELMPENIQRLKKLPGVNILGEDFLKECNGKYQRIIANPPFSGNQDIEHVYKMFESLTINGEMSVITSQHWKIAGDSKCKNFRKWIEEHNAQIQDIAAGEFKESGTGIQTSLIFIKKIRDDEIKRDKQASGQLDLFI